MHTYIHTYTYNIIYIYICIRTYMHTLTDMLTDLRVCKRVCLYHNSGQAVMMQLTHGSMQVASRPMVACSPSWVAAAPP